MRRAISAVARAAALLLLGTVALASHAQPAREPGATPALLAELNRDIWTPFSDAYAASDVDAYLALHRPDFVRGEGTRKRVSGLEEYAAAMRGFFGGVRERGGRVAIAFRFTERLARGDMALERGIYRVTSTPKDGAPREFHGRFHTLARKDGGRWRFAMDYDSNEGNTITRETFDAATAVDDFGPFVK